MKQALKIGQPDSHSSVVGTVGIFHPADPIGNIPGGIDTVVRGVLRWAPPDIDYILFGATSDPVARPVGKEVLVEIGGRTVRFVPIVSADPTAKRRLLPLTVRYLVVLRRYLRSGLLNGIQVMDFHRIEPLFLFTNDTRPKNVMIHQDMAILRNKDCDIGWRYAPALYEKLEGYVFKKLEKVFCVRQSAVGRYQNAYPDLAGKFEFLPTWVDTASFHPLDTQDKRILRKSLSDVYALPPDGRVVISVGRLDRQKDPLLLLAAFSEALQKVADLHLIMIGDGNLRLQVEAEIQSRGLQKRVSLLGALPPAKIAQLLRIADVFALSSAYEGMPIVVLEALASGVPVVTTDVGEVRLVVKPGINGDIAGHEVDKFAEAICRVAIQAASLGGESCVQAVLPYLPENVLRRVYENHRRQIQRMTS